MDEPSRGNWRRLSIAVEGFDKVEWPDVPRTPGRTSVYRKRVCLDENQVVNKRSSSDPTDSVSQRLRRSQEELKRRVGAPTKPAGKHGVSKRRFERLRLRCDSVERELIRRKDEILRLRKEVRALKRSQQNHSREKRAAFHSYLSRVVSARQIPFIVAACSMYLVGEVIHANISSHATILKDVRQVSLCLKEKLRKYICDNKLRYCIGFDSSTRGGKITSVCVSYFREDLGVPFVSFLEFRSMYGEKALDYVALLDATIKDFAGGIFCGIATDNTASMSGARGGVGVLLQQKLERFVRHDTCELHASASVIRVIENVWPSVKSRPSVTQFSFLTWYLFNCDWSLCRGYIVSLLDAEDEVMLTRIKAHLHKVYPNLELHAAAKELKCSGILRKPEKPSSTRWGTLAATMQYVFKYFDILVCVFHTIREKLGPGGAGSFSAMCTEWLRWSGSKKLRAHLSFCVDFISNLWVQYDEPIYSKDETWGFPNHFQVCCRPRRALDFLIAAEARRDMFTETASYNEMLVAYDRNKREVDAFIKNFYEIVCSRIRGNYGRYLTGIYLLCGLGDPYFASHCWQTFLSWKGLKFRAETIRKMSPQALRLKTEMESSFSNLDEHHRENLQSLLSKRFFEDAWKIVEIVWGKTVSAEVVKRFSDKILCESMEGNVAAKFLMNSRIHLSTTQSIEHTFSSYDNQPNRAKAFKTKPSQAGGSAPHVTLASARVSIAHTVHEVTKDITGAQRKKRPRIESAKDTISAVKRSLSELEFEEEEFQRAKECDTKVQDERKEHRQGLSTEARKFIDYIEDQAAAIPGARKTLTDLLEEGNKIVLSLALHCFGSDACLSKKKLTSKGRPGKTLKCTDCERLYHVKCLISEKLIADRQDLNDPKFADAFLGPCCSAALFAEVDEAEGGYSDEDEQ